MSLRILGIVAGVAIATMTGTRAVAAMEQATRNLSLRRAQAVRDAFVEYCRARAIKMDESRLVAASADVRAPKFPKPRSQEEWLANMRVVFVISSPAPIGWSRSASSSSATATPA